MKFSRLTITFIITLLLTNAWAQRLPFPQHNNYQGIHIKPSNYSQSELDGHLTSFYNQWKNEYLINGCEEDQYYIFFDSGNTITVSEAMGYGMMIVPIMAGYDENAKLYFDGLYRYYKAHPSGINPHLMSWKQITGCIDADGNDSATDGDLDIAFGLLLAHAQWGSTGSINYFQEALNMINAIMEDDINHDYWSVKLGDWASSGNYARSTRTSDFILDHFRIFECATADSNWNRVTEQCYSYLQLVQQNYSSTTGLLPDFIVDLDSSPRPSDPDFLEGDNDGYYYYNACRDPWRIATDYLISNDDRAKEITTKINQWLLAETDGNTSAIKSGYSLDGDVVGNWQDLSFIAPFAVGAMTDTENQQWLNDLYSKVLSMGFNGGYYGNSIKLLSLITISGNYWVPSCDIMNPSNSLLLPEPNLIQCLPNNSNNKVSLVFNQNKSSVNHTIQIQDIHGKIVWQHTGSHTEKIDIDVHNFNPGLYLVNIADSKSNRIIGTSKLIVTN